MEIIERRTDLVLEKLKGYCNTGELIDSVKLANAFGFEIEENSSLPELVNGIITCGNGGNQMAINYNLSKEKKRYSIAYLLSTYLLYYQEQDFFIQRHIDSEEENEASYMARLLLVPESDLAIKGFNNDKTSELADFFQVPEGVMNKRISEYKVKVQKR